jgi:hypothetical protein
MTVERLRHIVNVALQTLFAQIYGGRVQRESEAALQLHLGGVITTVTDLLVTKQRETFSIELEKPLADRRGNLPVVSRRILG